MSLLSFLIRFAGGERLEKATPGEQRWGAVSFLMIACLCLSLLLGQKYNQPLVDAVFGAAAWKLWAIETAGMAMVFFGMVFWFRHVPQRVTVALAVLAWAALLWLLFAQNWWDFSK
jgi:hypothetical protein